MLGNYHSVAAFCRLIFVARSLTTVPAHIQAIDSFYVQLLAHRLYLLRSSGGQGLVAKVGFEVLMWKWIVIGWQQLDLLLLHEGRLLLVISLARSSNDVSI